MKIVEASFNLFLSCLMTQVLNKNNKFCWNNCWSSWSAKSKSNYSMWMLRNKKVKFILLCCHVWKLSWNPLLSNMKSQRSKKNELFYNFLYKFSLSSSSRGWKRVNRSTIIYGFGINLIFSYGSWSNQERGEITMLHKFHLLLQEFMSWSDEICFSYCHFFSPHYFI